MNEVTSFKYWLAGFILVAVFGFSGCVVFLTNLSGEVKAGIIQFFLTVGALVVQYYFRKAGSNEAEPDIAAKVPTPTTPAPTNGTSAIGNQGSIQWTPTGKSPAAEPYYQSVIPTVDEAINEISLDNEAEDETGLAQKFKDKMLYWWEDMTIKQRQEWLNYAVSLARHAWQVFIGDATGKTPPTDYKQMEPENLYYGRLKKSCGDKWNPTASRGAIDVLHDLLKFQQTGEW
jgi:hypothetical protein